ALRTHFGNHQELRLREILDVKTPWEIAKLLGRLALAGPTEPLHIRNSLPAFRQHAQFACFGVSQPQAPALDSVQELHGPDPRPEELLRAGFRPEKLALFFRRE